VKRVIRHRQQLTRPAQEFHAGIGQRKRVVLPDEQRAADGIFKRADLLSDAGLREVNSLRRARKTQRFGGSDECPQLSKLEHRKASRKDKGGFPESSWTPSGWAAFALFRF